MTFEEITVLHDEHPTVNRVKTRNVMGNRVQLTELKRLNARKVSGYYASKVTEARC